MTTYNSVPISYSILDGFNTQYTAKPVMNISAEERIESYRFEELRNDQEFIDSIHSGLVWKLSYELMSNNMINFQEYQDSITREHVIRANVNAVKCEQQFANVHEQTFIVDGNKFTNDELIEAVKYTFPEKFI